MHAFFSVRGGDGDYAGWTADYGNFNVVNGTLEFGMGYYGWPTLFRGLTEADSDVSLSYRLLDVFSGLEVLSRYYYNSSGDCGSLSLTVENGRLYLTERLNGMVTAQTADAPRTSDVGQTYRLRMLSEGPRVRVWRTAPGEAPELLFDITTQVLATTQLRLVNPTTSTTAVDDVRVLGGPLDTAVEFDYDALGRRIGKHVETSSGAAYDLRYTYDGWRLAESGTANGTVLADYAYGNGLDELLHTHAYGFESDYYALQDDQGNVLALTDASGTILERYGYGPGGEPTAYTPQGQPQSGYTSAQLFAGSLYDTETGLYYQRYRYYDPEAGRFITRDPLGPWADPTALGNPYAYCGNSPWDTVDPFGLNPADPVNDRNAWRAQFFGAATPNDDFYWTFRQSASFLDQIPRFIRHFRERSLTRTHHRDCSTFDEPHNLTERFRLPQTIAVEGPPDQKWQLSPSQRGVSCHHAAL